MVVDLMAAGDLTAVAAMPVAGIINRGFRYVPWVACKTWKWREAICGEPS